MTPSDTLHWHRLIWASHLAAPTWKGLWSSIGSGKLVYFDISMDGCLGKTGLTSSSLHSLLNVSHGEEKAAAGLLLLLLLLLLPPADKTLRLFYFLNRKGGRCSRFVQSTSYPPLRYSSLRSLDGGWTRFNVTERSMFALPGVCFFLPSSPDCQDLDYSCAVVAGDQSGSGIFSRRKNNRGTGSNQPKTQVMWLLLRLFQNKLHITCKAAHPSHSTTNIH